ncbi:MAG: hypothetical protein ACRC28_02545 [Clostridium sp.]
MESKFPTTNPGQNWILLENGTDFDILKVREIEELKIRIEELEAVVEQ